MFCARHGSLPMTPTLRQQAIRPVAKRLRSMKLISSACSTSRVAPSRQPAKPSASLRLMKNDLPKRRARPTSA